MTYLAPKQTKHCRPTTKDEIEMEISKDKQSVRYFGRRHTGSEPVAEESRTQSLIKHAVAVGGDAWLIAMDAFIEDHSDSEHIEFLRGHVFTPLAHETAKDELTNREVALVERLIFTAENHAKAMKPKIHHYEDVDITVSVGDHVPYSSYNYVYTGRLMAISPKTVRVSPDIENAKRLTHFEMYQWLVRWPAEKIRRNNADVAMTI